MKIIGHLPGGYICQIPEDEVAKLCGFTYTISEGFKAHLESLGAIEKSYGSSDKIKLGVEIPVSESWERLALIRRYQDDLTKLAGTMHALADLVERSSPAAAARTLLSSITDADMRLAWMSKDRIEEIERVIAQIDAVLKPEPVA